MPFLQLIRPLQWLKNLMIFFPPFLGGAIFNQVVAQRAVATFVSFSLASGVAYIVNDICDRENDRLHPGKKSRPLASGSVTVAEASLFAFILALLAVTLAFPIPAPFMSHIFFYLIITSGYSLFLKNYPLADIFCISAGFLLRLEAGGAAFGVPVSEWLFLSVFLLSIFLSSGKRLGEKSHLGATAASHRRALVAYPDGFLQSAMHMTGGAALVTYTMYVIACGSDILVYSVPFCCFGLLRYIFIVHSGRGGDPTELLLKDIPLLIVGLVWALMVGWGIYGP